MMCETAFDWVLGVLGPRLEGCNNQSTVPRAPFPMCCSSCTVPHALFFMRSTSRASHMDHFSCPSRANLHAVIFVGVGVGLGVAALAAVALLLVRKFRAKRVADTGESREIN